ncbi:MAG: hypothetical protein PHV74_02500 [Dehalococcoidia bacterium]|nr:hypothetical protein [Dehalococcoidia bacterium]
MWLLMTALAALIASILWYVNAPEDKYKFGLLSLLYWGATLMWLVDHVKAYTLDTKADFFETDADATALGFCVVLMGLLVWLIVLLVSDPRGVWKRVSNR